MTVCLSVGLGFKEGGEPEPLYIQMRRHLNEEMLELYYSSANPA